MNPVCDKCGREMHCEKNGVVIRVGTSMYYRGDRFSCPQCKGSFITNFGNPSYPLVDEQLRLDRDPATVIVSR